MNEYLDVYVEELQLCVDICEYNQIYCRLHSLNCITCIHFLSDWN